MIKKFFWDKKRLYLIIFICATFGVLFSMIGTIKNIWGTNFEYFYYLFSYQSNTLVAIFYCLLFINFNYKYTKINFIHNDKLKLGIATYMSLVFLTVFLLIVPLEFLENFGMGLGGLTDFPANNDVTNESLYIVGNSIKNFFVHLLVPLLVIADIYFSKNKEKEFKINQFAILAIYPLIYVCTSFLIGGFTGIYPYQIFDATETLDSPVAYDVWLVLIFTFIEILLFTASYLICLRRRKSISIQ